MRAGFRGPASNLAVRPLRRRIVRSVKDALEGPARTEIVNPYGDGKAAERIVGEIVA